MKKMMTSLLAIVMLLSLCAGCGSKESAAPAQESQPAAEEQSSGETMVLRLANSHNAEHITSQACQMFADLVNEKKIDGISNANDESDREGMRIVIEL